MPDSIKCSKCDQEFTDEEAHKIHMNIDHGVNEVADSFQFTDSKKPLDEQEFLASNGVRGYNPNPNAGLYDNKLFRTGSSTERTSILGESYASEDFTMSENELLDIMRRNQPIRDFSGMLKQEGWNGLEETDVPIQDLISKGKVKYESGSGYIVTESYASESSYDEAVTLARKILIAKDIGLPNSNFFAHNVVDYVWKEGPKDLDIIQIQQAVSQAYRELGRVEESYANEETEYTGGDFCAKCGTEFEDKGECKVCNNGEEASDNYEVDVDEYLKTGEPFEKLPTDKRKTESYANEVTAQDIVNKLNSNLSGDYYPKTTGNIMNLEDLGDGNVRFTYSGGVIDDETKKMFEASGFRINNVRNIMDSGHLDAEGKITESYANENGGYCNKCGIYTYGSMKSHMEDTHPEVPRKYWKTLEYMGTEIHGDDRFVGNDISQKFYDNRDELEKAMGWARKDDGWSNKSDWGESYANEEDGTDFDNDGDIDSEDYLEAKDRAIKKSIRDDDVDYDKEDEQTIGFIEQQHTEPKEDNNKELDDVDISEESIDYVYPTKASEARERSYTTEAKMVEGLEEEYDDFKDSDAEEVTETVTLRKLHGFSNESIARELHITYGVPHEEALEKVHSIEVSTNDKVAQTFFGKMYKECSESEKAELRMYSGSD